MWTLLVLGLQVAVGFGHEILLYGASKSSLIDAYAYVWRSGGTVRTRCIAETTLSRTVPIRRAHYQA